MTQQEKHALIAERLDGLALKPHRDLAMVAIGSRKVRCTGPTFMLDNGRELPMPNGEMLRTPEGSDDWNARYFLHVAEALGDEIAAEVEAYRIAPPNYSADLNLCARVEAKIAELGSEARTVYRNALWDKMPPRDMSNGSMDWYLITAPAAARVDAMVALLQELGR